MSATQVTLEDKYAQDSGRVFVSGIQALVRLPLLQRTRDAAAGLNTAGFITGYRGSPLGGYDQQLERERARLEAAQIRFQPGVNEDLAATAVWGTQQVPLLPGAKYAGVFAIWYAKGPGVDRSGDPFKHGNRMGSSPHGGVLLVFGDDHPGKSSTVAHQSEPALVASGVPVLYPATVQECLDYGLYGLALSRFAGVWVGMKCVNETVEASATIEVGLERVPVKIPADAALPPEGVHARFHFDLLGDERRLYEWKLPLAQAFVRANRLDRVTHGDGARGLGLVAAGKSWLDVVAALELLGLDAARLAALGVALYKPALIWPLEPTRLVEFARGHRELLIVEEKAPFMEPQAAHALYPLPEAERPRLCGKRDPQGAPLLPVAGVLEPHAIARVIAARLAALGRADAALGARLAAVEREQAQARERHAAALLRTPSFCSGCPHNTSTRVPDGSLAFGGIGCHTMAMFMDRHTLAPTQMGGEGCNWVGIAPFTELPHVFQNLGDGTYFHSGLLAIRAAVTAGVNLTYKILYNDAVAMTGGQPVEGRLSVAEITFQLSAERVRRIAVVSDDTAKYGSVPGFAPGTTVHRRESLEVVQRELRTVPGVSAIIYDQTCAAEKRRRRKRGRYPNAERRVYINELVCEGCGDCSLQSNCVSIEPLETEFGRKRRIDQSSCNQDYSCLQGFCPALVSIEGGGLRRPTAAAALDPAVIGALPEPGRVALGTPGQALLITGIGGTGVVTLGAVLGMAAHLDGLAASVFDMTGLAQKGGAVLSHLKIAARPDALAAPRVGLLAADLVLGCDLIVSSSAEVLATIAAGRTQVVVNTTVVPTAAFQRDPDLKLADAEMLAALVALTGRSATWALPATEAALALLGDTLGANLIVVGYALQRGLLPVSRSALERAIELNGAAVAFNLAALALGRLAAHDRERFDALLASATAPRPAAAKTLAELLAVRERHLKDYQDLAYARRYRALIERVATTEQARTPGRTTLAEAVARGYAKLLAYKDEYEVARLQTSAEFAAQLASTFDGDYRLAFHLAPPLLARPDPVTGRPRKRRVGAWAGVGFRILARLKWLRGTAFDPFGLSAERRSERRLIADYEVLVGELLAGLGPTRHALAVELAELPERIRGFGPVKAGQIAAAKRCEAELLVRWRAG